MTGTPYALVLSEPELARYAFMARVASQLEADLWKRAGIVAGARVADIGCGPGALLTTLAGLVGPGGRVEAVDADPEAVDTARRVAAGGGPGSPAAALTNVTVTTGLAQETGLPAGAFDVVMLRHVLAHNGAAEREIVEHLATLLRPGGCLYLVDTDGSAVRLVPHHPELAELEDRYRALHLMRGNDWQSALRLGDLIEGAGLELEEYHGRYTIGRIPPGLRPPAWAAREAIVAAGLASTSDVERWDSAFRALEAGGSAPRMFVPVLMAIGRRAE